MKNYLIDEKNLAIPDWAEDRWGDDEDDDKN